MGIKKTPLIADLIDSIHNTLPQFYPKFFEAHADTVTMAAPRARKSR